MKNLLKKLALIACLVPGIPVIAQDFRILRQQCFGDSDGNYVNVVAKATDGFLLGTINGTGENTSSHHGMRDYWIIKTDTAYNWIWEKCYGGSISDELDKILPVGDGTYFLLGATNSSDGDVQSTAYSLWDIWVTKINEAGELLWERRYGCAYFESELDIALAPDKGFFISATIYGGGGNVSMYYGNHDALLCKCDSLGNIEWEKTLGNEGPGAARGLFVNRRGNIMHIGAITQTGGMVSCQPDGACSDVWITELDKHGNLIWQNCYGGSNFESINAIAEIDDGYVFAATSLSNDGQVSGHHGPTSTSDIWMVRINYAGDIIWENSFGGSGWELSDGVMDIKGDTLLLIGSTTSPDGDVVGNHAIQAFFSSDIWVVKVNIQDGRLLSQQCIGDIMDEGVAYNSVVKIDNTRYLITAHADMWTNEGDIQCGDFPYNAVNNEVWLLEVKDCFGQHASTPSRPIGPPGVCTSLTPQSAYYVPAAHLATTYEWSMYPSEAGTLTWQDTTLSITWAAGFEGTASVLSRSVNDCGRSDWSEPFYSDVHTCTGLTEPNGWGIAVWPNPADKLINFKFNRPMPPTAASIEIYDLYGRKMAKLPITSNQAQWDCSAVSAGLYIYKANINNQLITGRFAINR